MKQYDPVLFKKFCEEVIPKMRDRLPLINKKGKFDGGDLCAKGELSIKIFKIHLDEFLKTMFEMGEEFWGHDEYLDQAAEYFIKIRHEWREEHEPRPSRGWPWERERLKKTCKKPPTG